MFHSTFDFCYNPEGDYYNLVVDKKIQHFVDELTSLPHDVLIRYVTYWLDDTDSRRYEVDSNLPTMNGTRTAVTMQSARRMRKGICKPSL